MIGRKLETHPLTQRLAQAILRLAGWKLEVSLPATPKFVVIGAPHTSNFDLLYTLLINHAAGLNLHWIGKDSLFHGPLGALMRWLGGIPVNRRSSNNFVQQVVEVFNRSDQLVIAISPEGTRSRTSHWKTGFYYIALGARVPVALAYLDYGTKTLGVGEGFVPSGDIRADFEIIKAFYAGKLGRHPAKQGDIRLFIEE